MSNTWRGFLLILALSACAHAADSSDSSLRVARGGVESTNGLRVRVEAPGFRLVAPTHHSDVFHGHPYDISLAAFLAPNEAVLVHGERVTDASGASNYDNLAHADWPNANFRTRRTCTALSADDINGEHDLEWLRDNGFDVVGALVLDQSFLTTADHNNEVVVSVLVKNVDCADTASVNAAIAAARGRVRVSVSP